MINKAIRYLRLIRSIQQINFSLARGAASIAVRDVDASNPGSWEFSAFSQTGGDGISDYLTQKILKPNRYFIEIGSADGIENNTAWLAIAKKFCGMMVEGNQKTSLGSSMLMSNLNIGVECVNMFVNAENIPQLKKMALYSNPDVFSLDIDGIDYYVAKIVLDSGFRPRIFIVEYNSAFGPTYSKTIKYAADFNYLEAHESHLYYGVSISGWKKFFNAYGYTFVTVDLAGVNAFFINSVDFEKGFPDGINGTQFRENFYQMRKFKASWEKQYELIQDMDFVEI